MPPLGLDKCRLEKGRSPQGWAGVCLWVGEFAVSLRAWRGAFGDVTRLAVLFGWWARFVLCIGVMQKDWIRQGMPRVQARSSGGERGASVGGLLLFVRLCIGESRAP